MIGRIGGFMFVAAVLCVACGGPITPTNTASVITGAASCPADGKQDLTFSGKVTGHLSCSTMAVTCQKGIANAQASTGLAVPIYATVGGQAVFLIVMFWTDNGPGTYVAGPPGEGGKSNQGVTLDGIGHWVSQTGSIVTAVDDASSVSGTLDVQMTQGPDAIHVSGAWRCVKPAGFCKPPAHLADQCYQAPRKS